MTKKEENVSTHRILTGKALKFGDDISTDLIAPGRLLHLRSNLPELAKHVFEDADPTFASRVKPGDFVVAGNNFGMGSSREHAPRIIKMAGVSAVLANSAARIFFRNAINVGLPVLLCNSGIIQEGDELEVDLALGTIKDITNGAQLTFAPLPKVMLEILDKGGLVPYILEHGDFAV